MASSAPIQSVIAFTLIILIKIDDERIGGYDPVDLGRGVTYAGNPRLWLVAGQRLYLFGREENRDAFAADPARFLKDAATRWPILERGLAQ